MMSLCTVACQICRLIDASQNHTAIEPVAAPKTLDSTTTYSWWQQRSIHTLVFDGWRTYRPACKPKKNCVNTNWY